VAAAVGLAVVLSAGVARTSVKVPVHQPPDRVIVDYVHGFERPDPPADVTHLLCPEQQEQLLRQRQAFLDQLAAHLRLTRPLVRVTVDLEPTDSGLTSDRTVVSGSVLVQAAGVDSQDNLTTFRSPRLDWRFHAVYRGRSLAIVANHRVVG
jgi:hypothetical protein